MMRFKRLVKVLYLPVQKTKMLDFYAKTCVPFQCAIIRHKEAKNMQQLLQLLSKVRMQIYPEIFKCDELISYIRTIEDYCMKLSLVDIRNNSYLCKCQKDGRKDYIGEQNQVQRRQKQVCFQGLKIVFAHFFYDIMLWRLHFCVILFFDWNNLG